MGLGEANKAKLKTTQAGTQAHRPLGMLLVRRETRSLGQGVKSKPAAGMV